MRAAQPDPAAARADVAERFSRDDMDALKRAIARVAKTQATLAQKKKAAALAGTADTVEDDFPTQHTSHTGHQTTRNHTTRELPRVTAPIEKPLKNKGTKLLDTKLLRLCTEKDPAPILKALRQNADPDVVDRHGRNPLHIAAKKGNVDVVQLLIDFRARVTTRDADGNTALHCAALGGHASASRILLRNGGASPNIPNMAGQTAVHCAVEANSTEVLAVLVKDGRTPALDLRDDKSMTPLLLAVAGGHETQSRILLTKGANPLLTADSKVSCLHVAVKNADLSIATLLARANRETLALRDTYGRTPLHLAAADGNIPILDSLVRHGGDPTETDVQGRNSLHWAIVCGRFDCAVFLLGQPCSQELVVATDKHGASPLHYAVPAGRDDGITELLSHGADVGVADISGRTPLTWAVIHNQVRCAKALLSAGADVNASDKSQFTPLHFAAYTGRGRLCRLLLMHGAELDVLDANEQTPLFHAVNEGHAECAKMLLMAGAREDATDIDGRTPLHWAAAAGSTTMCLHLLDHDAPPDAADAKGVQPVHEAAAQGHGEVITALIGAGASADAPDQSGTRPLHWAALAGDEDVCEILLNAGAHINAPDYAAPRSTAADFAARAGDDALDCLGALKKRGGKPWANVGEREREECWIELGEDYDPKREADVFPQLDGDGDAPEDPATNEANSAPTDSAPAKEGGGDGGGGEIDDDYEWPAMMVARRAHTPPSSAGLTSTRSKHVVPNLAVPTALVQAPPPKPTPEQRREAGWDARLTLSETKQLIERKPIRPTPGSEVERKPINYDAEAPGLVGPLTLNRGNFNQPRVPPSELGSAQLRARLAERERELKNLKAQYSQMVGRSNVAEPKRAAKAPAGIHEHVQALKKTLAEALSGGTTDPEKQQLIKEQLRVTLGDVKELKESTEEISKLLGTGHVDAAEDESP